MFHKFLRKLAEDVFYGFGNPDNPKCPNCGGTMTFHGGELSYGNGYWDCDSCDYTFTEDEMNEHFD